MFKASTQMLYESCCGHKTFRNRNHLEIQNISKLENNRPDLTESVWRKNKNKKKKTLAPIISMKIGLA